MKANVSTTNEKEAKEYFKLYSGKIKFWGMSSLFRGFNLTENESLFSYAIAKFQNLVIFEE